MHVQAHVTILITYIKFKLFSPCRQKTKLFEEVIIIFHFPKETIIPMKVAQCTDIFGIYSQCRYTFQTHNDFVVILFLCIQYMFKYEILAPFCGTRVNRKGISATN